MREREILHVHRRPARRRKPRNHRHAAVAKRGGTFCAHGIFGPHNLHENRPGTFQSEETIFATYNVAGVRVFDIRDAFAPRELAYWVSPPPKKMIDPRPNVELAAKTADILAMKDGLVYVTDWNAGLNVLQYEG